MKTFYGSFTSFILEELCSLGSGEVIGDSVEKLARILTIFSKEQPLLYEKAFIPLDSILELCTIFQVSETCIRGLHYLSAENAREIMSNISGILKTRITYFGDDDNTDYEKGIGAWHLFYDSNSLEHGYVDDSTYEVFEAGVLEIFQKYLEYSPKRDFPIIRIGFTEEILQVFSWGLLAYGRECKIYLFLRDLILDHREYRILHKYWSKLTEMTPMIGEGAYYTFGDPNYWKGWQKMAGNYITQDKKTIIEYHFMKNIETGEIKDLKPIKSSTRPLR